MNKCKICGEKVSFWKANIDEKDYYCKKCWKEKKEKEKKELGRKEQKITKLYCPKCNRRYNVQGKLGIQPESILGILTLILVGIGFIRRRVVDCSYCDGRLKKYHGQKLQLKNFSWAEPKTINASELKIQEKEETNDFIFMLKTIGVLIAISLIYFLIRWIF